MAWWVCDMSPPYEPAPTGHRFGDSLDHEMDATRDADAPQTLLITLTGKDRPGVTSSIFSTLSHAGVEVLDIEQIVLRRRLVLGLLVSAPRDWRSLRTALTDVAEQLGMTLDVERG